MERLHNTKSKIFWNFRLSTSLKIFFQLQHFILTRQMGLSLISFCRLLPFNFQLPLCLHLCRFLTFYFTIKALALYVSTRETSDTINRKGLRMESSITNTLSQFIFSQKSKILFRNTSVWCCRWSPPLPFLGLAKHQAKWEFMESLSLSLQKRYCRLILPTIIFFDHCFFFLKDMILLFQQNLVIHRSIPAIDEILNND